MQAYPSPQVADKSGSSSLVITPEQQKQLAEFLARQGHKDLLPMLQLVQESRLTTGDLIATLGKAAIESLLQLSAQQVVGGPKQQGKRGADRRAIRHHGTQDGIVELAERKLSVRRPRLRRRQGGIGGEVPIPAYQAMHHSKGELSKRMLEILLHGVSTRRYAQVLPEMADSVGISKSAVSRQAVQRSGKILQELMERCFDEKDILIIWIDGMEFAGHHILAAVGVDGDGSKHVLGICQGAAENTVTVTALLESMVERGIKPTRRRLFVIDGSKALRAGIDRVYGTDNPVQRCRNHKLRNVVSHLPQEQQDQAKAALQAAWKLPAAEGMARLESLARWYEKDQPGAAASLREGLAEMFTINRLGLPKRLCRCLSNTNLIDSGHSAVRRATGRVTRWRDGSMALRWAASAFVAAELRFGKIQGWEQLWMLKAHLDEEIVEQRRTG
jgi:transposase-like protein